MKKLALSMLLSAIYASAGIVPTVTWTVDVGQYQAHGLTVRSGESVILQPAFYQAGVPLDLRGAAAVTLFVRQAATTNGGYHNDT